MKPRSKSWRFWGSLSCLAAVSFALAVGWWWDHRAKSTALSDKIAALDTATAVLAETSAELDAIKARLESKDSGQLVESQLVTSLRAENDRMMLFVDEVYTLLFQNGIHIKLDYDIDRDGHLRLRANTATIIDKLKGKLQELQQ